ncbi:hypothetical protein GCM10009551_036000 [Nocardiopsis tropica]
MEGRSRRAAAPGRTPDTPGRGAGEGRGGAQTLGHFCGSIGVYRVYLRLCSHKLYSSGCMRSSWWMVRMGHCPGRTGFRKVAASKVRDMRTTRTGACRRVAGGRWFRPGQWAESDESGDKGAQTTCQ